MQSYPKRTPQAELYTLGTGDIEVLGDARVPQASKGALFHRTKPAPAPAAYKFGPPPGGYPVQPPPAAHSLSPVAMNSMQGGATGSQRIVSSKQALSTLVIRSRPNLKTGVSILIAGVLLGAVFGIGMRVRQNAAEAAFAAAVEGPFAFQGNVEGAAPPEAQPVAPLGYEYAATAPAAQPYAAFPVAPVQHDVAMQQPQQPMAPGAYAPPMAVAPAQAPGVAPMGVPMAAAPMAAAPMMAPAAAPTAAMAEAPMAPAPVAAPMMAAPMAPAPVAAPMMAAPARPAPAVQRARAMAAAPRRAFKPAPAGRHPSLAAKVTTPARDDGYKIASAGDDESPKKSAPSKEPAAKKSEPKPAKTRSGDDADRLLRAAMGATENTL